MIGGAAHRAAAISLLAVSLATSACAGTASEAGEPWSPPGRTSSTTRGTTVAVDVSLPSAHELELDLPGVQSELDLTRCSFRVSVAADTLRFPQNSAELPATGPGRDVLNAVIDRFASADTVEVFGHASTEGSPERNDEVARQRAEAVAEAGRARHPEVAFVPTGMGSTSTTVVEDGTEATRAVNRRVELSGQVQVQECAPTG